MDSEKVNPNFIPLSDIRSQIGQLTGVLVSKYAVEKWLKTGEIRVCAAPPNTDRRYKYVTKRELLRFIKSRTKKEVKLPEDLQVYDK